MWSVVYGVADGERWFVASIYQRPLAARALAVKFMLEQERRVLGELTLARTLAAGFWPNGRIAWALDGVLDMIRSGAATPLEAERAAVILTRGAGSRRPRGSPGWSATASRPRRSPPCTCCCPARCAAP
jgi:hypothetical protein